MITFMRRSHLLLAHLSLLLVLPLEAQTAMPAPAREIYTVLAFGDPVFEPEVWRASAAELDDRTTATWQAGEYGALGYAELLHFDGGYTPRSLAAWFDDAWFEVTFKDYDHWQQTAECAHKSLIVHEFSLDHGGTRFAMRYWIMPVSPTRVLAFHLVFPQGRARLLENYSRLFTPAAYRCVR